jgi:hypothetical protein
MARIAFAWELGGEFGHAMACAALARVMHARGHRIAFIFRELHQLAFLPDTSAYDVFQAPVRIFEGAGAPIPVSYADIMLGCGYVDPGHITGLLGGWLALFRNWKPDLIVSDFAPTGLLAARFLGLKRVSYSNGFSIPPRLSPLPAFRFDEPVDPARVQGADRAALASSNAALAQFGGAPMRYLHQQLETDEDFLATFPELDSYGNRPATGYWGPRFSIESGASVHWPAGPGRRVLVYLKKNLPQLDAVIAALAASPHRVIAFIPELEPARRAALAGPRRIVSERPVRLGPLLRECDLFLNQGGNVSVGTLMSGVPQLVFPSQYEQYLTAYRIEQLGAGLWLGARDGAGEVAGALDLMLGDGRFLAAARAYAARYPAYSPAEQQRRIVARIEEIIAAPSRWPASMAAPILTPTSRTEGTAE